MKAFVDLFALVAAVYAEAEADPALLYANGLYAAAPYAFAGLKSAPCVNAANVPVPCAGFNGYAGYSAYPYAYGLLGKKKREAEADPAYLYAGYPYAGLGYAGLGYAGLGYAGLGYAHAPLVHSSHLGVCTNYVGAQVPC